MIKISRDDGAVRQGHTRLTRPRLLIVEDDRALRIVFERSLATDYDVAVVSNGDDALELLRRGETYALILSDLMMPGMDGMALHAEVERLRPAQAGCMVFLSGGATTDEGVAFLQRHRWLRKPIAPSRLLSAVAAWLASTSD